MKLATEAYELVQKLEALNWSITCLDYRFEKVKVILSKAIARYKRRYDKQI